MAVSRDCLLKAVKLLGDTIDTLNKMSKASKGSRDPLRVLLTRLRKVRLLLLAELDKPSFAGGNILKKVATWLIEAVINNIQCTFSPQAFSRSCRDELINGPWTCFKTIPAHGWNQTEGPRPTPRHLFQLPVFG